VNSRPRTPCTVPGCPARATGPGPCPVHHRQRQQHKHDKAREQYGGAWPDIRLEYLARHPWCKLCPRPATIADHWPRTRKQLLRAGVTDPDLDIYLRPLCPPCHNHASGLATPGGLYARRLDTPDTAAGRRKARPHPAG
jgi:5-methylcytosine-specific restriction enzyme A